MTALNILMEADRVHLLTDGATYDLAGVVRAIGSKVVRSEALRVAIGYSGRTDPPAIAAALQEIGPGDGAELVRVLPELASKLKRSNTAACPEGESTGDNDLQLALVLYDHHARRPRAFLVSTGPAWMGAQFPVGRPVEVREIVTPAVDMAQVRGFPPRPLQVDHDGRSLLEAQRRTPFRVPGGDQWCVGGFGERHTVSAAGLERVELCRWPDHVGCRITP